MQKAFMCKCVASRGFYVIPELFAHILVMDAM